MRYYQIRTDFGEDGFVATTNGSAYDLTDAAGITSFGDLVRIARVMDESPSEIAAKHIPNARTVNINDSEGRLLPPVEAAEVWAAGVTYEISEEARKAESSMPEIYLDVYDAERPEIFFKATPDRVVGPGDAVGIRTDSDWNVPEPELGLVLFEGDLVGYTIGNDVSSRSIEGKNPLYLPQAKVYDRCCSIGPGIAAAESIEDPHDLEMSMEIVRDSETVYEDSTSTSKMVRSCEELISYFTRHNSVPQMAILLTGTSLVPSEEFTLTENDHVYITIEGIGRLTNTVSWV